MDIRQLLRNKAILDFYSRLDDEGKKKFLQMINNGQDNSSLPVTKSGDREPYWVGVSQNIVGEGIYDIGVRLLRRLFRSIM